MTTEIDRHNRIGAEIMGGYVVVGNLIGNDHKMSDWSPATNLNHNAMVMDTFNDWNISKQKSKFRKGRIYTCTIWTDNIAVWFIGQADQEPLARARAYEKIWEVESENN